MRSQERRHRSGELDVDPLATARTGPAVGGSYAPDHLPDQADHRPGAAEPGHGQQVDALTTMLAHLDVEPGMRVLAITTGDAGECAVLHDRLADASVVTAPVGRLQMPGRCGGFDRVLVTVPVVEVSYDWVNAVRCGGVLVVPWVNPFAGPSLVRLTADDNRAAGTFVTTLSGLGDPWPGSTNVFDLHAGTLEAGMPAPCTLDPATLWADSDMMFAFGMRLPDLSYTAAETRDGSGRIARWVYAHDAWAGVTAAADGGDARWEQYGIRKLWAAVEGAYRWWVDNDRPAPDAFGMTVASFGQFGWLGNRYSGRIWRL